MSGPRPTDLVLRRAALLAREAPRPGAIDRALGPAQLVFERSVPGPAAEVRARLAEYFTGQLLQIRRHFGDRVIWEPAPGPGPALRRFLDLARRYALPARAEVEAEVAETPDGRVRVRLAVDLADVRRHKAIEAAGSALVGGSLCVLVLAAGGPLGLTLQLVGLAAGGSAVVGPALGTRRDYRRVLARARAGLERLLDLLEHERG